MYLSASEFALPLFGESLPLEEKATLAREILREETSTSFRLAPVKGDVHRKPLTSFVSPKSRTLVVALGADDNLGINPELWSGMASYTRAKELVASLKVVNDCAERGVSLVQDYTNCLARDEEQRQFLLQLVADHYHKLPKPTKANLV